MRWHVPRADASSGRFSRGKRLCACIVLPLLAGCEACDSEPEPGPLAIVSADAITIFPEPVMVEAAAGNQVFRLRARVRDNVDGEIPEALAGSLPNPVVWTETSDPHGLVQLNSIAARPHSVRVTVVPGSEIQAKGLPAPQTVTLRASIGGISASASLLIFGWPGDAATPAANDLIFTPRKAGSAPEFLLVDGKKAGCPNDEPYAFVGGAFLGNFIGACTIAAGDPVNRPGVAAMFSQDMKPAVDDVDWKPVNGEARTHGSTLNPIDSSVGADVTPWKLPIKVWNATGEATATVEKRALADITKANTIFKEARLGIEFTFSPADFVNVATGDFNPYTDCDDLTQPDLDYLNLPETESLMPGAPNRVVNVVYGEILTFSVGFHCHRTRLMWKSEMVIIDWKYSNSTTLAHELGHVLALRDPDEPPPYDDTKAVGHTDPILPPAFDNSNLMFRPLDSDFIPYRRNLSLGQLYRAHAEQTSWLFFARGTPHVPASHLKAGWGIKIDCGLDSHADENCPKLWTNLPP